MFGNYSYLAHTLIFCVPLIVYVWLRNDFFCILKKRMFAIVCGTLVWTIVGPHLWYVAMHVERLQSWEYKKTIPVQLFGYIYIEDVVWWFCVAFLFSSFWVLATQYEDNKKDVVVEEALYLFKSMRCAFRGLFVCFSERNIVIEISIAVAVILGGIFFHITFMEWAIVLAWIAIVIGFELHNTALERLVTKMHPEQDPDIRDVKDISAGSVLIPAILAGIMGAWIFWPKLAALF